MSLESIVNVSITSNSRGVSQKGFGTALVIGYHTAWLQRYKVYSLGTALADLVADGIPAGSPIHRRVQGLASSTPKPDKVVIGRLGTAPTHKGTITVKTGTVETGKVFSVVVIDPSGVEHECAYTAVNADTPTIVAAALNTLITALTGITSTSSGAVISWTADTDGQIWRFTAMSRELFDFEDTTADSNLVTDLSAITTLYPDWYGLILADAPSKARILALAAAVETMERIQIAVTRDTGCLDGGSTTDLFAALKAALYYRTAAIYSADQASDAAATWVGNRFPFEPGSSTWAYKPLSGVVVDELTTSEQTAAAGKNGNIYVEVAGAPITLDGKMGSGEWIDVVMFRDWLVSRIREAIFGLLINTQKIPFTDAGVQLVTSTIESVLTLGINRGGLAATPAPFVTAPAVADVSDADKIARTLPDVYFEATLAGAIHKLRISGVLKV